MWDVIRNPLTNSIIFQDGWNHQPDGYITCNIWYNYECQIDRIRSLIQSPLIPFWLITVVLTIHHCYPFLWGFLWGFLWIDSGGFSMTILDRQCGVSTAIGHFFWGGMATIGASWCIIVIIHDFHWYHHSLCIWQVIICHQCFIYFSFFLLKELSAQSARSFPNEVPSFPLRLASSSILLPCAM